MTLAIAIVFIFGYALITLENNLKVNKTAIALLLSVVLWVLYMANCTFYVPELHADAFNLSGLADARDFAVSRLFVNHVGDTSEIIFFLLGAMTIVEVVDANGGFNFVRDKVRTKSMRALLWRVTFITFLLSAVLDNLTSSIVMVMVLRKLVPHRQMRMRYAGMVVLAANAGGAFSPIGDVTTIMLWIKGNISSIGVIKELLLPSLAAVLVPLLIVSRQLKGELVDAQPDDNDPSGGNKYDFSFSQRNAVFYVGVLGLVSVPIFRALTGLPPFMGVLFVLAALWTLTEVFYRKKKIESHISHRVGQLLERIDLSTLLFFLGILMAVAALEETGALHQFGEMLNDVSGGNPYLVTGVIGVASSIVDNVPLVASCMGMYDMASATDAMANPALLDFVHDGQFWQLLAFCAGVGGSILIIGSAAGVIVMGLEHISFGWYLRNYGGLALIGLLSGMLIYWVERVLFFNPDALLVHL